MKTDPEFWLSINIKRFTA